MTVLIDGELVFWIFRTMVKVDAESVEVGGGATTWTTVWVVGSAQLLQDLPGRTGATQWSLALRPEWFVVSSTLKRALPQALG